MQSVQASPNPGHTVIPVEVLPTMLLEPVTEPTDTLATLLEPEPVLNEPAVDPTPLVDPTPFVDPTPLVDPTPFVEAFPCDVVNAPVEPCAPPEPPGPFPP